MKTRLMYLFMLFVLSFTLGVQAQEAETEEYLSENLDLEAVASLFGDSDNLEVFEKSLNDPENKVSNLDLNGDEQVDYLRVMETTEEDTHLVAVQAVVGEDEYQDVATIEVEKDEDDDIHVQVVGDVYLYGPNYIIEPVYVYRPPIFSIFWRPLYRPYRSVFYWGYYPRYWRFWRPFPVHRYRTHVAVHVNVRHTYRRTTIRRSHRAVAIHTKVRRNDFGRRYPNRSYAARSVAVNRGNGTRARAAGVNHANGTKRRAVGINQADGNKYRAAGVNRADGTKKRAVGVNKADGTKKRAYGVNQADGDKYRVAGKNSPDGTKTRVAGVNKANGTKKRVATKKNPDGSRNTVAVRKNPNGSKRVTTVKKDANGNRKVKTAIKPARKPRAKRPRRN